MKRAKGEKMNIIKNAKFIRNNLGSQILGNLVQGILGVFAVFMALNQLGIATDIVNQAFVLIVGAVAVAFAIAFGLGGRDFASKQLDKLDKTVDTESEKVKSTTAKNNEENTELQLKTQLKKSDKN